MPRPHKAYLLSLDYVRGVVTRYVHHRGWWGPPQRLQRAEMPEGALRQAEVTPAALEHFRLTGRTE